MATAFADAIDPTEPTIEAASGSVAGKVAATPAETQSPGTEESSNPIIGKAGDFAKGLMAPFLGILVFLGLWAALAPQVDTSLGALPGPVEVAEQVPAGGAALQHPAVAKGDAPHLSPAHLAAARNLPYPWVTHGVTLAVDPATRRWPVKEQGMSDEARGGRAPLRVLYLSWRDRENPEAGGAETFTERTGEVLTGPDVRAEQLGLGQTFLARAEQTPGDTAVGHPDREVLSAHRDLRLAQLVHVRAGLDLDLQTDEPAALRARRVVSRALQVRLDVQDPEDQPASPIMLIPAHCPSSLTR